LAEFFLTFDDNPEGRLMMWEVRKIVGGFLGRNLATSLTQLARAGKQLEEQLTFWKNLKMLKGFVWFVGVKMCVNLCFTEVFMQKCNKKSLCFIPSYLMKVKL